jgi:hypothetical protein
MVFPIVSQKNWDARKIIFPFYIAYAIFRITLWRTGNNKNICCKRKKSLKIAKGVIRIRISKKNRQHNGQKKKYKRTNNNLQKHINYNWLIASYILNVFQSPKVINRVHINNIRRLFEQHNYPSTRHLFR